MKNSILLTAEFDKTAFAFADTSEEHFWLQKTKAVRPKAAIPVNPPGAGAEKENL